MSGRNARPGGSSGGSSGESCDERHASTTSSDEVSEEVPNNVGSPQPNGASVNSYNVGFQNVGNGGNGITAINAMPSAPHDQNPLGAQFLRAALSAPPLPTAPPVVNPPAPQRAPVSAQLPTEFLAAVGAQVLVNSGLLADASNTNANPVFNGGPNSSEQIIALQLLGLIPPRQPTFDASSLLSILFAAFLHYQQGSYDSTNAFISSYQNLGNTNPLISLLVDMVGNQATQLPTWGGGIPVANTDHRPVAVARAKPPTPPPIPLPVRKKRKYDHESAPEKVRRVSHSRVHIVILHTQTDTMIMIPKLHRLIMDAQASGQSSIICFLPTGDRFQVLNSTQFEQLLPEYFRTRNASSFKRLLRMYGFRKTNGTWVCGTFEHPLFHRDHPEWCTQMQRIERTNNNKNGNEGKEDEDEDDNSNDKKLFAKLS